MAVVGVVMNVVTYDQAVFDIDDALQDTNRSRVVQAGRGAVAGDWDTGPA
jgi:hypothetical protein